MEVEKFYGTTLVFVFSAFTVSARYFPLSNRNGNQYRYSFKLTQKRSVRVPPELDAKLAEAHVVDILEVLEVGDGDTARVREQVWQDQHTLLA